MPTRSITAYVVDNYARILVRQEGYAARAALYDNVVSAASQVIKQRQADPVQFSLAAGQAKPIDMSNMITLDRALPCVLLRSVTLLSHRRLH